MPNYKNGKIYSIRSYQTDNIYIGSTTRPLSERMNEHRSKYKKFLQGNFHYLTSFEILKYEDAYIELIQEIPCNNIMELNKYEGNYIRHMDCVNKRIEGRTKYEWRKDNGHYRKKKYNCCCGSISLLEGKARHNKSIKHRQYIFNLHNELNHL